MCDSVRQCGTEQGQRVHVQRRADKAKGQQFVSSAVVVSKTCLENVTDTADRGTWLQQGGSVQVRLQSSLYSLVMRMAIMAEAWNTSKSPRATKPSQLLLQLHHPRSPRGCQRVLTLHTHSLCTSTLHKFFGSLPLKYGEYCSLSRAKILTQAQQDGPENHRIIKYAELEATHQYP